MSRGLRTSNQRPILSMKKSAGIPLVYSDHIFFDVQASSKTSGASAAYTFNHNKYQDALAKAEALLQGKKYEQVFIVAVDKESMASMLFWANGEKVVEYAPLLKMLTTPPPNFTPGRRKRISPLAKRKI